MIRRGKALEIACWVVGTAVITLYFDTRLVGEIEREQGIGAFGQARAQANTAYPNFVTPESFAWPEFPPLDVESVPVSFLPERLDLPVFADTSERSLNWAAGWVDGTAAPDDGGNIALAAHRDGYFYVPGEVAPGDVLIPESIAQDRKYPVMDISIVEPGDTPSRLATETDEGDLVTCYPFYFAGHPPQQYAICAMGD